MDLRRIKIIAAACSFAGLLGFELLRHFVVQPALGETSRHLAEHVVAGVLLGIAVVAFTFAIFRLLERAHAQLIAVNEASAAVTADLSLEVVLGRVAELARSVAGASYASVHMEVEGRTVGSGRAQPGATTTSLPIVVRGRQLGELVLASPSGTRLRLPDRAALEAFATNAGIAIENARLFAETQELVALRERARIGMDLHDGMIQELYAVGLKLDDTEVLLTEGGSEAERSLTEAREALRLVIAELRTYVYGLRDVEAAVQVDPLLERLGAEFSSTSMAVRIVASAGYTLPAAEATHVAHIVREAMSNALRHAFATRLNVVARCEQGSLVVEISDDGDGFEPALVARGLGLNDMRTRATMCGGRVTIRSRPGAGTTVVLTMPAGDGVRWVAS